MAWWTIVCYLRDYPGIGGASLRAGVRLDVLRMLLLGYCVTNTNRYGGNELGIPGPTFMGLRFSW